MSHTTTAGPRTIIVVIAELGILLAAGMLAIALVGNDGSERAEESAARPELVSGSEVGR